MIFVDVLAWLVVARIAVLLVEDVAYAVRGKQSPRRQERARRAAEAAAEVGDKGTAGSPWRRAGDAAGEYVAGLLEDATAWARARRRRAAARRAGKRAVDGMFVDIADDGRWYADCDLCGWHSRPYRIEANAQAAGREHTRTEHPDQYSGPQDPDTPLAADDMIIVDEQDYDDEIGVDDVPGRPTLRVIRGGAAQDPEPDTTATSQPDGPARTAAASASPADEPSSTPTGRYYTMCARCLYLNGPTTTVPFTCPHCRAGAADLYPVAPDPNAPQEETPAELFDRMGLCTYPVPSSRYGLCGAPTEELDRCPVHTSQAQEPDEPVVHDDHTYCLGCSTCRPAGYGWRCRQAGCTAGEDGYRTQEEALAAGSGHSCAYWECGRCGTSRGGYATVAEAEAAGAEHDCGSTGAADGPPPTPVMDTGLLRVELFGKCSYRDGAYCDREAEDDSLYCKAHKVAVSSDGMPGMAGVVSSGISPTAVLILEAAGPEEIRAAITQAADIVGERAERHGRVARTLGEIADRCESQEMAPSTVERLREAAKAHVSAAAALDNAQEELQAALADFNAKDGQVADAVADAGNLAGEEVLV